MGRFTQPITYRHADAVSVGAVNSGVVISAAITAKWKGRLVVSVCFDTAAGLNVNENDGTNNEDLELNNGQNLAALAYREFEIPCTPDSVYTFKPDANVTDVRRWCVVEHKESE